MIPINVPGFDNLYLDENAVPYQKCGNNFQPVKVQHSSTYARVSALKQGKKVREHLHVLMAITFLNLDVSKHGVHSESLQIDHRDGNKLNNALSNLEIVTKKENFDRAFKKGVYLKNGYASKGKAKPSLRNFSKDDIKTIKEMNSNGASYRSIAQKFGCNHGSIYQIIKGLTYQDVG